MKKCEAMKKCCWKKLEVAIHGQSSKRNLQKTTGVDIGNGGLLLCYL